MASFVGHCTGCKAHWGNAIVILGKYNVNTIYLVWVISITSPTDANCDFTMWADFFSPQSVISAAKEDRARDICWVLCGKGRAEQEQLWRRESGNEPVLTGLKE